MNRSNLLIANKGHMGGYMLPKAPAEITVREILESAEGSLAPVSCMDNGTVVCNNAEECLTLPIYKGLYDVVINYLESVTLQDIIDKVPDNCEYYI